MGSRPILGQEKIGSPLRPGGNWSRTRLNGIRPESPRRPDLRFLSDRNNGNLSSSFAIFGLSHIEAQVNANVNEVFNVLGLSGTNQAKVIEALRKSIPALHIDFHTPLSKDLSNARYVSFGRQLQAAGLTFEQKRAAVWSILSSFLYVGNSGVETNLAYADVQAGCDASGTGCVFAMDSNTQNLNSPVMYFPTRGQQPWWRWISDLSNNPDTFGTLYQIIGWAIEYYQTFPERIPQGLFLTPPGSNSPALPPSVPRPIPAAPPSLPPAAPVGALVFLNSTGICDPSITRQHLITGQCGRASVGTFLELLGGRNASGPAVDFTDFESLRNGRYRPCEENAFPAHALLALSNHSAEIRALSYNREVLLIALAVQGIEFNIGGVMNSQVVLYQSI